MNDPYRQTCITIRMLEEVVEAVKLGKEVAVVCANAREVRRIMNLAYEMLPKDEGGTADFFSQSDIKNGKLIGRKFDRIFEAHFCAEWNYNRRNLNVNDNTVFNNFLRKCGALLSMVVRKAKNLLRR